MGALLISLSISKCKSLNGDGCTIFVKALEKVHTLLRFNVYGISALGLPDGIVSRRKAIVGIDLLIELVCSSFVLQIRLNQVESF